MTATLSPVLSSSGPLDWLRRGWRPDPAGAGEGGREWDTPDPDQQGQTGAEPAGHGGDPDAASGAQGGEAGSGEAGGGESGGGGEGGA